MKATDTAFDQYIESALWSSVHYASEDDDGVPFDEVDAEFHPDALKALRAEFDDFLGYCDEKGLDLSELDETQVAHDFWLTRNGHGVGFWDRGLGQLGEDLSEAARTFGSADIYLGDDNLIYQS